MARAGTGTKEGISPRDDRGGKSDYKSFQIRYNKSNLKLLMIDHNNNKNNITIFIKNRNNLECLVGGNNDKRKTYNQTELSKARGEIERGKNAIRGCRIVTTRGGRLSDEMGGKGSSDGSKLVWWWLQTTYEDVSVQWRLFWVSRSSSGRKGCLQDRLGNPPRTHRAIVHSRRGWG